MAVGPSSYGRRRQFLLTVVDIKSNESVAFASVRVVGYEILSKYD